MLPMSADAPYDPALVTEILAPPLPQCAEPCGACTPGEAEIVEVMVAPGDEVAADQCLVVFEGSKTTVEVPAPHAGRVVHLLVGIGDPVIEGMVLVRLARPQP